MRSSICFCTRAVNEGAGETRVPVGDHRIAAHADGRTAVVIRQREADIRESSRSACRHRGSDSSSRPSRSKMAARITETLGEPSRPA